MKIILDEEESDEAVRADLAWGLFFGGTKTTLEGGPGMPRFAEWLWDELGEKVGNFNCSSKGELRITIPSSLEQNSIDFLLRLASFWGDDVRIKRKGGTMSDNIWKKPIVNVFDDETLDGSERVQKHELDDMGSMERNFMPTLGPGARFLQRSNYRKRGVHSEAPQPFSSGRILLGSRRAWNPTLQRQGN